MQQQHRSALAGPASRPQPDTVARKVDVEATGHGGAVVAYGRENGHPSTLVTAD